MRPSHVMSLLTILVVTMFSLNLTELDRASFILLVSAILGLGIILDLLYPDS